MGSLLAAEMKTLASYQPFLISLMVVVVVVGVEHLLSHLAGMTLRLSTLLYSAFLGKGWGDMTVFSMVLMGIDQLWSNPFLIFQTFLSWLERAEFCWDLFNLSLLGVLGYWLLQLQV